MRIAIGLLVMACCGLVAPPASAAGPVPGATHGPTPPSTTCAATDLRPAVARMRLKAGLNPVCADGNGGVLAAVADRTGAITGYVSVDAAGKVSTLRERPDVPVGLAPGEAALVHKCYRVTQECANNPLPRSGDPADCMIEIPCPARAFRTLLSH